MYALDSFSAVNVSGLVVLIVAVLVVLAAVLAVAIRVTARRSGQE